MMMAGHEKSEKGRGNKATAKRFSSTLNRPQNGDITRNIFSARLLVFYTLCFSIFLEVYCIQQDRNVSGNLAQWNIGV